MAIQKNEINLEIENYTGTLKTLLDNLAQDKKLVEVIKMIDTAYQKGSQIFIFGNGGSAASASHIAVDLNKGTRGHTGSVKAKPFRVICLNDCVPTMTAWANDTSYDDIFAEQVKNLAQKGDLVIGISASGNSANIVKALSAAKKNGAKTIALVGFSGGKAKTIADKYLHVDSSEYGPVEDIHMVFGHFLTAYYMKKFAGKEKKKK